MYDVRINLWPCPRSPVENGQLPDPANWGVADVVNYFKATGFEEQASAFQDQVRPRVPLRIPDENKDVNFFHLHLTGNRRQVSAADDTQRRADGAVHQARPRAENLRVPREAAANAAPEEQCRVATLAPTSTPPPPQWQSPCQENPG